jgi:hypothetical protein
VLVGPSVGLVTVWIGIVSSWIVLEDVSLRSGRCGGSFLSWVVLVEVLFKEADVAGRT